MTLANCLKSSYVQFTPDVHSTAPVHVAVFHFCLLGPRVLALTPNSWLQRLAAWHCAAMPRTRGDGRLGLNALQATRSGMVTNSAHTLEDVGPAVHAALLRNMDGLEYNAMRLASAEPAVLAKWLRVALKAKSLKDLPLPTHDMTLLLEASSLEFRRVNQKPRAQCTLQPVRVS